MTTPVPEATPPTLWGISFTASGLVEQGTAPTTTATEETP